jgi:hypothetical protein
MEETIVQAPPKRSSGRLLFTIGLLLPVIAIAAYMALFSLNHLGTPWYVPILTTVAVAVIAGSIWVRRSWVRILSLVLIGLMAGFEWFFVLVATRLPPYAGPVTVGQPLPAFAVLRPDGSGFTDKDCRTGNPMVIDLYRGHW